MIYLSMQDMLYIHQQQIELFGGQAGVRDAGLVQAALLRPQTGYYTDVIEEAAALWESLTMNHGFVDGNKRVGFAATDIFLGLNGHMIQAEADEVAQFILAHLDTATFEKTILDKWLRERVQVV